MSVLNEYPRATLGAAVLILLLSGTLLLRNASRKAPYKEELKAHYQDMGLRLQTATEAVSSKGKLLVLVFDLNYRLRDKKQFKQALGSLKKNGFSILHVEPLVATKAGGWSPTKNGFPYSEYVRVVQEFEDADAVISLCGLPYGFDRLPAPSPAQELPPLLIANVGPVDTTSVEDLLDDGWIQAAVVDKNADDPEASPSGDYILRRR